MRQQEDRGQIDAREDEIRDHLGQYDPQRPHGRDQQDLHRSGFLFTHDGHGSHHRADEQKDQPHDARHEVVSALHLRIVHRVGLDLHRGGSPGAGQHALCIPSPRSRDIRVGRIEYELDRRSVLPAGSIRYPPIVIRIEDHHQIGIPTAQYGVDVFRGDVTLKSKIIVGRHPLHLPADLLGMPGDHGGKVDVVHLGRNGKAEEQHLYHRHQQNDEHRARIAQDVQRFFADKRTETSHDAIPPVLLRAPGDGTPGPSSGHRIVFSTRPACPKPGSDRPPSRTPANNTRPRPCNA